MFSILNSRKRLQFENLAAFFGILLTVMVIGGEFATASTLSSAISGEVSGNISFQLQDPKSTRSQTNFRLAFEDTLGIIDKFHISTVGSYDITDNATDVTLDELFFAGYAGDLDYLVGRSVISWGTADGFNPTNYFNHLGPKALTQGSFRGEPLWHGQLTYYAPEWTLTGVAVPFFVPQDLNSLKDFLPKDPQAQELLKVIDGIPKPKRTWQNIEYGIRAETMLAGWDVQLSYFSGFEPLPGLYITVPNHASQALTQPMFGGEYRRQHLGGIATAGTLGKIGVWGEVAFGGPTPFKSKNPGQQLIPLSANEDFFQVIIGADYTLPIGQGLYAQGQYIYRGNGPLLSPYEMEAMDGGIEAGHYAFSRISYNFNADNGLEILSLHGLKEYSGLVMPTYTYRFPNDLKLQVGLLTNYGDGEFDVISPQVRAGVTYQF